MLKRVMKMKERDAWMISMGLSCFIIMVYAAFMMINPVMGLGFVIYGLLAFILSLMGYLRALEDNVQDFLDDFQEKMLVGGIR